MALRLRQLGIAVQAAGAGPLLLLVQQVPLELQLVLQERVAFTALLRFLPFHHGTLDRLL